MIAGLIVSLSKPPTGSQIDGNKFKSEYEGDTMKRVLMIFPSDKSKELEKVIG